MRRSRFDYDTYRGRKSAGDWLKGIALVLAILVVLAVAILLWGQQYISYTDNGLRVELPFFQGDNKKNDGSTIDVIDQEPGTGDVSGVEDGSQEQGEEQPQVPLTSRMAFQVPLSALLDGSAVQLAREQGADSVVVDMKNDQGQLGWSSQQPLGTAVQSAARDEQVNEKLRAWNQGELYTAARLSCFLDEEVGGQMSYTLQTASRLRWKDDRGFHWSDPSNQQVQDYLIGLMTEVAQLGFDEIILDHCGYPTQADGPQGNIRYDSQQAPQTVTNFLARAAQALEPYETKLSLEVSQAQAESQEPGSGLNAQNINQYAQRIWVAGEEQVVLPALTGAGMESITQRLVVCTQGFRGDSSVSQAVLSQ